VVFSRFIIFSAISILLSACGGGGTSSSSAGSTPVAVSVPSASTVSVGDALSFVGQASSSAGQITQMSWQTEALTLGANPLTAITNADCKTMQTSGNSASCTLQLTPPAKLTADYTYKLTLLATDAAEIPPARRRH
jgi:hypothetical protein